MRRRMPRPVAITRTFVRSPRFQTLDTGERGSPSTQFGEPLMSTRSFTGGATNFDVFRGG
jgi:hypothetical protein